MPLVLAQTRRSLAYHLYRLVSSPWPNNGRNKPPYNCFVKTFTFKTYSKCVFMIYDGDFFHKFLTTKICWLILQKASLQMFDWVLNGTKYSRMDK